MRILFVHQNFPGQYKHLAPALAARGHQVEALCLHTRPVEASFPVHRYSLARGTTAGIHPWAAETETKVLRGEACAQAALALKAGGFDPDLICVHPGWGEGLFLRSVWPRARQLHYLEFFYGPDGQDVGFDPEFGRPDFDALCKLRMKNANSLLGLDAMDEGICPTRWQASTYPTAYRDRIHVIHDGIDTDAVRPAPGASLSLRGAEGGVLRLGAGDEVITFVNRNLEPSRGYHVFMRALPALLRRRPRAQVLLIGGDGASYGAKPVDGSYKARYLDEVKAQLDLARVHFLGKVDYATYLRALQISSAHVYLTYPFVLSWSLLEAMSAGCLVVASATAPVCEVIEDRRNGLLFDFFSSEALTETVCHALEHPLEMAPIRAAARATVTGGYDLRTQTLPAQIALVERMG
jgi:glycosyltransferase involved in cell wall biosynthesis